MALTSILETLEEQSGLYEQLLESAKVKTPVLVSNDVNELNGILQKEKKLIAKAEELERARIQSTHRYFNDIGYKTRMNTLTELIRSVNHPGEKQKLLQKQQELSTLLAELKRTNELNQQLITQSLAFINYTIDLVVEDPMGEMTYQHPHNKLAGNARTGIFDTRA